MQDNRHRQAISAGNRKARYNLATRISLISKQSKLNLCMTTITRFSMPEMQTGDKAVTWKFARNPIGILEFSHFTAFLRDFKQQTMIILTNSF